MRPVYKCGVCRAIFMQPEMLEIEGGLVVETCPGGCGADMTESQVLTDYLEIHQFWSIILASMEPTEVNRLRLIAESWMT